MVNKNDERILQLRKQIKTKKEKIGKVGRFTPVTNCSLEIDGVRFNLNVLDREKLLQLLVKLNSYFMSSKTLGVQAEISYSGYNLGDWISDVLSKLEILNKKDEEKSLSVMESKLDKLLSDDKQVELELDTISDLLKD